VINKIEIIAARIKILLIDNKRSRTVNTVAATTEI
jgi:hypothetical protein